MPDNDTSRQPLPAERSQTMPLSLDVKGAAVVFPVVTSGTGPIFFCLGVRKSGSTLLNAIVRFLAKRNNVNEIDIPGTFFRKGLLARDWADLDLSPLVLPQNLYLGFRVLPPRLQQLEAFRSGRKVFMFRDPRDSLVSQYFSDAYSHGLPTATGALGDGREAFLEKRAKALATPIDDFVLAQAPILSRTMEFYAPLLEDPACLSLRYEEHLFQKRRLVAKILRHFDWTAKPGQIEKLMGDVDVIPETEDKERFLRKAIPGDHRQKLRPETIAKLDRIMAGVLQRYDYV